MDMQQSPVLKVYKVHYLRFQFAVNASSDAGFGWTDVTADHDTVLSFFPPHARPDVIGYIGKGKWLAETLEETKIPLMMAAFHALKSEAPHRFRHDTRIRVVPLLSRRVVFKRPMRIPRSLLRVERPLKLWVSQYYIDFHTLFRGHECPRCHEEECRICREGFEMDQWVRVLSPCEHMFHAACIDRWLNLRRPDAMFCPTCRGDVLPASAGFTDVVLPSDMDRPRTRSL